MIVILFCREYLKNHIFDLNDRILFTVRESPMAPMIRTSPGCRSCTENKQSKTFNDIPHCSDIINRLHLKLLPVYENVKIYYRYLSSNPKCVLFWSPGMKFTSNENSVIKFEWPLKAHVFLVAIVYRNS